MKTYSLVCILEDARPIFQEYAEYGFVMNQTEVKMVKLRSTMRALPYHTDFTIENMRGDGQSEVK